MQHDTSSSPGRRGDARRAQSIGTRAPCLTAADLSWIGYQNVFAGPQALLGAGVRCSAVRATPNSRRPLEMRRTLIIASRSHANPTLTVSHEWRPHSSCLASDLLKFPSSFTRNGKASLGQSARTGRALRAERSV